MRFSLLLGAFLLLFSRCSEPESSSAFLQKQLDTNLALWLSVKPEHYKFDYTFASAAPYSGPKYTVEVQTNLIISVFNHETNALMDPSTFNDFQVIDNFFDDIQKAITQKAVGLTVAYNQDKGYPQVMAIDMKEIIGDEVNVTVSALISL